MLRDQVTLGQMPQHQRQENNQRNLHEHPGNRNLDHSAQQALQVKRRQQGAGNQANYGHLYRCGHVAPGKPRPGNGHTGGRQQRRKQYRQAGKGLIREKQQAGTIANGGQQHKVDQLGNQQQLATAPLHQLAQVHGYHHRVNHQEGQWQNGQSQRRWICQLAGYKPGDHGQGDAPDQVLLHPGEYRPHGRFPLIQRLRSASAQACMASLAGFIGASVKLITK